jgi:cell division septation protein DedD
MDDDFNPDDLRPVPYQPDTELTLGWGTLLGILMCLVALCGLCFWQGYSMGSHSAHLSPVTGQQTGQKTPTPAAGSAFKPSAGPQGGARQRASVDDQTTGGSAQGSNSAAVVSGNTVQAAVRPALPDAAAAPALMVQIAAVSHQEDADVLVAALRKRGYAVSMSRDPADSLIHVRIGPFTSLNDANTARQKLLNDGYNAVVQP